MEEPIQGNINKVEIVEKVKTDSCTCGGKCACSSRKNKLSAAMIVLIVASMTFGLLSLSISAYVLNSYRENATSSLDSVDDGNLVTSLDGVSIESIVEKVAPSVVSIISTSKVSSRDRYYYYGYGGLGETSSAGTGVIVSSDGLILTNKHVVEGGTEFSIVTDDGESYSDVELVMKDPLNDVAYLRIKNASELKPAEIGDSKTISAGQEVVAIGNALGQYQNTVTSGIVSGTGRTIEAAVSGSTQAETLVDMIQTDAAINSGNSGGPLVNAAGQVIGINTAVSTEGQGIGFAIPIGAVKGTLKSITTNGVAKRAFLGVSYLSITPDVATEFSLDVKNGAYIYTENGTAVRSGSPAAKAGIKDGDIILKVGGQEIGSKGSLSVLAAEYAVGETVELVVLRNGKEQTVSVTLEAYED